MKHQILVKETKNYLNGNKIKDSLEEEIKNNNENLVNYQKQEEHIKVAMQQTVGVLHTLNKMLEKLSEDDNKKKK